MGKCRVTEVGLGAGFSFPGRRKKKWGIRQMAVRKASGGGWGVWIATAIGSGTQAVNWSDRIQIQRWQPDTHYFVLCHSGCRCISMGSRNENLSSNGLWQWTEELNILYQSVLLADVCKYWFLVLWIPIYSVLELLSPHHYQQMGS